MKPANQATEDTYFDKLRMSGNTLGPIMVSLSNHVLSVANCSS
jgi:hypothetical protein